MFRRVAPLVAILALVAFVTQTFAVDALHPAASTGPLSRAGAVALAVEAHPELKKRLEHYRAHRPPMPLFADIDYDEWYAPYIETAFEAGMITGTHDGRFRPADTMTEEEAIALTVRLRSSLEPQLPAYAAPEGTDWIGAVLQEALAAGLKMPFPVKPGADIARNAYFTLLASAGIADPRTIALSIPVRPEPVISRPIAQRPAEERPRTVRQAVASPPAQAVPPVQPAPPAPQAGQASSVEHASQKFFAISMPSLGVKDLTVTHPTDALSAQGLLAPLQQGVGHLFSYPGKGGKILVYGHSSSFPWDVSDYTKIFRQINKLAVGDKVYVTYNGQLHVYQVSHKQTVLASDMSVYQQGGGEELILYTCWPPDSIKERYLVHAKPVETVALR